MRKSEAPSSEQLAQLEDACKMAREELHREMFRALVEKEKERLRQTPVPLWRRLCRKAGSWLSSL